MKKTLLALSMFAGFSLAVQALSTVDLTGLISNNSSERTLSVKRTYLKSFMKEINKDYKAGKDIYFYDDEGYKRSFGLNDDSVSQYVDDSGEGADVFYDCAVPEEEISYYMAYQEGGSLWWNKIVNKVTNKVVAYVAYVTTKFDVDFVMDDDSTINVKNCLVDYGAIVTDPNGQPAKVIGTDYINLENHKEY
ncbi:MAG: hypothetical protein ACPGJV_01260 [Bacteriovoracaceae bacterium]